MEEPSSRRLLVVPGHLVGGPAALDPRVPYALLLAALLGLLLTFATFSLAVGVEVTGCPPVAVLTPLIAVVIVRHRRTLKAAIEVHASGLAIRTREDDVVLAWDEIRGVFIEPDGFGFARVSVQTRQNHVVDSVDVAQAYQLRHAVAHLGRVPEPEDVVVDQRIEWNEARFTIRYPVYAIPERRVAVGPEFLHVRHRRRTVAKVAWSEIRRIERARTGEVSWRTDRGQSYLLLVPPPVADAIHRTMVQQWEQHHVRRAPPDAQALGQLESLRGRVRGQQ